jgi:hypothetical protein
MVGISREKDHFSFPANSWFMVELDRKLVWHTSTESLEG